MVISKAFPFVRGVVGSELFAYSSSLAVIMGGARDGFPMRQIGGTDDGQAGGLIWLAVERCAYGGGSAVRAFAFPEAFSVSS